MLELALALRARGHEVELACPEAPAGASPSLCSRARSAGLAPQLLLERARGIAPVRDARDAARLRTLLVQADVGVVHCWHTRDHGLALRAAGSRRRAGRTRVVRSYKSADPIAAWPWNRWLFGPASDGLMCVSPRAAERNRRLRGGRPTLGAFGAVDLERFRPAPPDKAVRESLGLSPEHRVVGIVARAQRHRRFDLLLEAAARAMARDASLRLLIVGRGTHIDETARAPAGRLGIADRVIFAGYRDTDYADVLRCADLFTFLVPGSDGGCRAVLEAAACGLPAVVSSRGALPEIVIDGETGRVVPEAPAALADAWLALLHDSALRARLAAAARRRAQQHFAPEELARQVEALYQEASPLR
jgi:glycosyltransferase involved in cell wall biosynthesis